MINSLLDLDFYKLTMGQLAFLKFPNLKVKWEFKNRTDINLSSIINIDDLKHEIELVRNLSKIDRTREEIDYLKSLGIFNNKYLEFFKTFKLPKVKIKIIDGDFKITTSGYWKETIYWETMILSIVNELYYNSKYPTYKHDGYKLLEPKLDKIKELGIPFTDFGTRRRFSASWHEDVISYIITKDIKTFAGTSNVYLAMKYGLKPIGTNAHELYMIAAGFWNKNLVKSQNKITDMWWDMYGYDLSIALTDTFGTKQFFKNSKNLLSWKGLRHDSGDPFIFGEKVIQWYLDNDIDPKTKLIVFSDGLDIDKMVKLWETFNRRIGVTFGWGTKLTNDVGFETLSIVMKVVKVISNGDDKINNHLVKLSDNLNKAIGKKSDILRYKKDFEYDNLESEDLIV